MSTSTEARWEEGFATGNPETLLAHALGEGEVRDLPPWADRDWVAAALAEIGYHLAPNVPLPDRAPTRRDDPETSHSAVPVTSDVHRVILEVLFDYQGGLSDRLLGGLVRQRLGVPVTDASVRTRRHELVEAGRVAKVGMVRLPSGRMGSTWGLA